MQHKRLPSMNDEAYGNFLLDCRGCTVRVTFRTGDDLRFTDEGRAEYPNVTIEGVLQYGDGPWYRIGDHRFDLADLKAGERPEPGDPMYWEALDEPLPQ
jgi:hypothetical protein